MPATGTPTLGTRERHVRLLALGLAALLCATLAATWGAPTEARDWTPQIRTARGSQVYWEGIMRGADAQLRSVRKAKKQAKARLKQVRKQRDAALARRATAKHTLNLTREELREAKAARQAAEADLASARASIPAPPDLATATSTLGLAGLQLPPTLPLHIGMPPTRSVTGPAAERTTAAAREVRLLEKRATKHKRQYRKTVRRAKQSIRNVRFTLNRLASLKRQERAAISRRERAERSLGAWILAAERYTRARAQKTSRYRPGIDSPFAWPAQGRISQGYNRRHDGLDIAGYRGSAVRAAAFGVVAFVGWNPWDEGKRAYMVVLAHRGGLSTVYGHLLPRRAVVVGQTVRQGELVGYMGNTGKSSGTHLHFEVRRGRTTVSPLGYL